MHFSVKPSRNSPENFETFIWKIRRAIIRLTAEFCSSNAIKSKIWRQKPWKNPLPTHPRLPPKQAVLSGHCVCRSCKATIMRPFEATESIWKIKQHRPQCLVPGSSTSLLPQNFTSVIFLLFSIFWFTCRSCWLLTFFLRFSVVSTIFIMEFIHPSWRVRLLLSSYGNLNMGKHTDTQLHTFEHHVALTSAVYAVIHLHKLSNIWRQLALKVKKKERESS